MCNQAVMLKPSAKAGPQIPSPVRSTVQIASEVDVLCGCSREPTMVDASLFLRGNLVTTCRQFADFSMQLGGTEVGQVWNCARMRDYRCALSQSRRLGLRHFPWAGTMHAGW